MADGLSAAVEELEKELQKQLQDVASTKKLINSLLIRTGQSPRYTDIDVEAHAGSPVKRDQYYGKPLATAVAMVLKRLGQASTAEEIIAGLEKGGFDFRPLKWNESVRHRNLAISMAKNTKAFHKLPNGTFGLREWYDEDVLKKTERVSKGKDEDNEKNAPDILEELEADDESA